MRPQHILAFVVVAVGVFAEPASLARRAALEIISPPSGETIVAGFSTIYDITWKNSTTGNVTISLRQGTPDNMTLVYIVSPTTYNNGSFAWRGRDDRFLLASPVLDTTRSNCNYALEFRTPGEVINSGYFTVINQNDGGIKSTMKCPTGKLEDSGSSNSDSSESSSNGDSGGNGTSTGTGGSGNGNGGVSGAALGGAVGGAIGGLLLVLAALFFAAKKLGWIISKKDVEGIIAERLQSEESKRAAYLQGKQDTTQVDGSQVYQMP